MIDRRRSGTTLAAGSMAVHDLLRRAACGCALVLLAGCHHGDHDVEPSRGELGFAVFEWGCTSTHDVSGPSCLDITFPRDIVLGGTFDATFRLAHGVPSRVDPLGLESGSPRYLTGEGGRFTAVRLGRVALLALGHDSVIDYTNLYIRDVTRVAVAAADDQPPCPDSDCSTAVFEGGAFVLFPGGQVRVEAIPFNGATQLWGRIDWAWTSTTPELLSVSSEAGGTAVLHPQAPGTATVEVTGGGVTETITLVVLEGPPAPPPGDTGDGTATGDTATGDTATGGTASDATAGDTASGTATDDTASDSGTAASDGSGSGEGSSTGGGS